MSSISAGTTSGTALVSTGDTTGTLDLKTGAGATTALSIDASQRVGIGTSSPAQRLDVRTTSGNAYVGVGRASQSTGQVGLTLYGGTSGTDWIIYQPTSSNNLTFYGNGSDQVVITSGGKVGIGVTNPSALLDVRGSAPYMYVSDTVGANKAAFVAEATNTVVNVGSTYLGAAAVPLALVVGGAEKARIDSSGNLGLGVTPSATTGSGVKGFEIGGIGNGLLGNSANVWATQNVYFNAGFKKAGAGYATMYNQSGGTHNWNVSTTSGGAAGDAITFTQAMTLDASSNLNLRGNFTAGSAVTTTGAVFGVDSGGSIAVGASSGDAVIRGAVGSGTTNRIVFAQGNTGNIYGLFDGSGNVGIGTSSPNDKLTVASDNYLSFQTSSTTFNSGRVARIGGVSVGSGNGYLVFETYQGGSGGGERMRIDSSGNVGIGTTSAYNSAKLSVNGDLEARGNIKSYYSSAGGISNGATQNIMTLPAGSYGSPLSGMLNIQQRNDNTGNLTMSTYLVSAWGGAGAIFTAVSTINYGSGSSFSITASTSGGDLTIYITNTSGATSTSINFSFMRLAGTAPTYAF